MAELALTLEHEEFLGLSALVGLEKAVATDAAAAAAPDAAGMARTLLREALAGKLASAGLPWAPSAEAVAAHKETVVAAGTATAAGERLGIARKYVAYVLAIAAVVVLVGGYGANWQWTGFQSNGQLWDWLSLLLLPVVVGVIPMWIRYREHIGKARRISHGVAFAAWIVLVIAGYVIPLAWTGFRGQTLWNWLSLFLLPVAVAGVATIASMKVSASAIATSLRVHHRVLIGLLLAAFIMTVIGGYGLGWTWTGYQGNTLWDWLQLLLLPLVVPTVMLPGMLKWIAGEEAWEASRSQQSAAAEHVPAAHRSR